MSARSYACGRDVPDTRSTVAVDRGSQAERGPGAEHDLPLRAGSLAEVIEQLSEPGSTIVDMTVAPYAYGSSHPLEAIDVAFDDGSTLALLRKSVDAGSNAAAPAFIREASSEAAAYAAIPGLQAAGAPALHAIITDASGNGSLVFERINGTELYQYGQLEAWTAAAEWLAAFHINHLHTTAESTHGLLVRDAGFHMRWWRRALEFARRADRDPRDAERLAAIEPRWRRTVERLCALPSTLVHGEFYPSNIMIEASCAGHRIRPVDWEMAGSAPALLDLAALVGGNWDEERRDIVINTYRYAARIVAEAMRVTTHTLHDFDRTLDDCRLALAVQWLGWSADWSPPAEQANDWLAEALAMAVRPD